MTGNQLSINKRFPVIFEVLFTFTKESYECSAISVDLSKYIYHLKKGVLELLNIFHSFSPSHSLFINLSIIVCVV